MTNSYTAEISRQDPGCILFLLDQSGSMVEQFGGDPSIRKANAAADAINKLLTNLVLRCTQNMDEGPRNYFDVGVIGYGARSGVGPCFGGALSGRDLVSIQELAASHLRVEERVRKVPDGAGGVVEMKVKFPVWFDPVAEHGTPMLEALQLAHETLRPWVAKHANSYPPIVINITDGEPHRDPRKAAAGVASLSTADGNVLIYNIHLSKLAKPAILFPASSTGLPDNFARMLFEMSAIIPPQIQQELSLEEYNVEPSSRGFIFNTDPVALIQFLDIGTRLVLEGAAGDR